MDAYEIHAHEIYARERGTPIRCMFMRYMPVREARERDMVIRCTAI